MRLLGTVTGAALGGAVGAATDLALHTEGAASLFCSALGSLVGAQADLRRLPAPEHQGHERMGLAMDAMAAASWAGLGGSAAGAAAAGAAGLHPPSAMSLVMVWMSALMGAMLGGQTGARVRLPVPRWLQLR